MNEFLEKIERSNTISIVGHIRPDGDCVGSCLGVYNYIIDNYSGKRVDVYLEKIPDKFMFLNGAETIIQETSNEVYDLSISLDCGDTDRHGRFAPVFANARDTICLDHHRSNKGFGNMFYLDADASSCCEVICRFLDMDKVSFHTAEALYLGIIHDTGVLKYPATSEQTMICAGRLMSKGVRTQYIIDETFYKVNYNQCRLAGQAMLSAKLAFDGKVIYTCVTKEMFEEFNATKDDTDGIVDKIRVVDGVETAIFVYQIDDNRYKFSLRSVAYVDVSRIAVSFGGGGHIRAAGFEAYGDYNANLNKVLSMIEEQL